MTKQYVLTILLFLELAVAASAQFDFTPSEPDGARYIGGPRLGKSQIQIWRTGIILEPGVALSNVMITLPVPMEWREQRIISVSEEKMDANLANRITYPVLNNGAREMQIRLPSVRPVKPLEIVVAFEVQNYELLPPDNPGQYVIPSRVPRDIEQYLRPSPCIESDDPIIKKMYTDITKERRTDWDKVEALYSFVQNNVKYNDVAWKNEAKGALSVVKMPKGEWTADCKDMSCLFVALCRTGKIPARIVRVPEHCYAEFYMEMKQDTRTTSRNTPPLGFWFPCQVSGAYAFGGIPERRVILQKGDAFPDPDNPRAKVLFIRETFQGTLMPGSPDPEHKHKWIHEAVLK